MNLYNADCIEKMKELPENSVDSIVCDPPYELGFMGKSWDSTGIANNRDMWAECLRVLKPGGHLLAFSGTRTYHRMAVAIEDAGFEVRDMIEWCYGSGFPKSLNIGKAVDKLQGNEREVVGKTQGQGTPVHNGNFKIGEQNITKGTSEYEGWGTALKPAHEPICMARKPLAEKTVAENVLKYGTGGINIDKSRVGTEGGGTHCDNRDADGNCLGHNNAGKSTSGETIHAKETGEVIGRFPANLIHDNSEEVRECFPETKTGKAIRSNSGGKTFGGENTKPIMEDLGYDDIGGNASRFFKSIIYQAKASKSDRGQENKHPTVKPVVLMEYLITMITRKEQTVLDPFMGSGTTGVACKKLNRNFIGIELDKEYFEIARKRIEATPPVEIIKR